MDFGIVGLQTAPTRAPTTTAATLAALDSLAAAHAPDNHLVVTPELALTGYGPRPPSVLPDTAVLDSLCATAARHDVALVVGHALVVDGAVRNAAVVIDRRGRLRAVHVKAHLFGDERRWFAAGDGPPAVVDLDGLRVAVAICYDAEFPEYLRMVADDVDLVVVPAVLFGPAATVRPVLELVVPARAWESRCYVLYVNVAGDPVTEGAGSSLLAAPDGTVQVACGPAPGVLRGTVRTDAVAAARAELPYLRDRRPALYAGHAGGPPDGVPATRAETRINERHRHSEETQP
ncbi:nitrilase-related carbon-nitrogen hydrolase [Nocardioides pantholopis]|uniref:nitrilase-related carbon-nitrogen hydrolase n=1 Tax=Nocardioides pantholopis TaxID=2483798 RepID=UPI0013E33548|nr:nitrilase-related carbon-nitrogen hydrolase [Nocardioides pantholopis]